MPIPRGARQVAGSPNRVELRDGRVVTRATARTLGAQEMGYKNERDRSKHGKGDDKYYNSWIKQDQGKRATQIAKDRARAEGIPFRTGDLKSQLIAARNSRPNRKTPAGPAWIAFMDAYDFVGSDRDISQSPLCAGGLPPGVPANRVGGRGGENRSRSARVHSASVRGR
jgi:hypothetical protein